MFSPQKASFSSFPLVINLVRTSCVFFLLFRITEGGDGTRNRVILIRSKKTLRDWLHVLSVGTRSSDLFATVACTSEGRVAFVWNRISRRQITPKCKTDCLTLVELYECSSNQGAPSWLAPSCMHNMMLCFLSQIQLDTIKYIKEQTSRL